MGQYLGRENTYGIFEKQNIVGDNSTKDFVLDFKVGSASSILVISTAAGISKILEPNYDYSITDGGKKISFISPPIAVDDSNSFDERTYIVYLGKQLAVPARPDRSPLLIQHTATNGQTELTIPNIILTEHGTIIFKNKEMLRFGNDFTIDNINHKIAFTELNTNDLIDVYIFGGIERLTLNDIEDQTISTAKIINKQITPNKLNLSYNTTHILDIMGLAGMNVNIISKECKYQDLGNIIKLKAKFIVSLTGIADNKIRISIPYDNNGDTNITSTTTITTNESFESGIVRWGGVKHLDIYRQFGVNYNLNDEYTIETTIEYEKE